MVFPSAVRIADLLPPLFGLGGRGRLMPLALGLQRGGEGTEGAEERRMAAEDGAPTKRQHRGCDEALSEVVVLQKATDKEDAIHAANLLRVGYRDDRAHLHSSDTVALPAVE
eukprot:6174486-Pleurochrysis_carterae.AAC.1